MLGSNRNYNHSTQNRKANNFVVTRDSWKCLWKKLQDFEKFLLAQSIFLRGWGGVGGGVQKYFLKNARIRSKLLPFDA